MKNIKYNTIYFYCWVTAVKKKKVILYIEKELIQNCASSPLKKKGGESLKHWKG